MSADAKVDLDLLFNQDPFLYRNLNLAFTFLIIHNEIAPQVFVNSDT